MSEHLESGTRGFGREERSAPADPAVGAGLRDDAYALVIGIDRYADPAIPNLRYACADAQAVHATLIHPVVGRIRPENAMLLRDEEATERGIRSALEKFLKRKAGPDDTVLVYFAGHGAPVKDESARSVDQMEKFLLPHDAEADALHSSAIAMESLQAFLAKIESKRMFVFLDCCYSGVPGTRAFVAPGTRASAAILNDDFIEQLAAEGRVVMTACKAGEVAHESPDLGHGLFTQFLVRGLEGEADVDRDGLVTTDELYDFICRNVQREARALGGRQTPMRHGAVTGRVYLSRYETAEKRRARENDAAAAEALAAGNLDLAATLWREALASDPTHDAARAALTDVERRLTEARDGLARRQRTLLARRQSGTLPAAVWAQASDLLEKDPSSLAGNERTMRDLLDEMLAGTITVQRYVRSVELLSNETVAEAVAPASRDVAPVASPPVAPPRQPLPTSPSAAQPPVESSASAAPSPIDATPLRRKRRALLAGLAAFVATVAIAVVLGVQPDETTAARPADHDESEGVRLFEARNYAEALPLLQRAAEGGSARAKGHLAEMYLHGNGVTADDSAALALSRASASGHDAGGMIVLAWMLERGRGTPPDLQTAAWMMEQAAIRGSHVAMANMGVYYVVGIGVPVDSTKAVTWFQRAVALGNAMAMFELAKLYRSGVIVDPASMDSAVALYDRAARGGHGAAMFELALLYQSGTGVPVDQDVASHWFQRAKDAGYQAPPQP